MRSLCTATRESLLGGSDGEESACHEGDWVCSLSWDNPLEKGIAARSSILAWEIQWTEALGGL